MFVVPHHAVEVNEIEPYLATNQNFSSNGQQSCRKKFHSINSEITSKL